MPHDDLKTTLMALAAVLLMVFAASFAHATPIDIEVGPSKAFVSDFAAMPK